MLLSLLLSIFYFAVTCTVCVKFEPFVPTESYKCGVFLHNSVVDAASSNYYNWINYFIRILSKPFPHQDLLNQQALSGDQQAWLDSFTYKYPIWLQHEQWWIVLSLSCIIVSFVFTLGYVLYRCCVRCCRRSKKPQTTDQEYDGCKRILFDFVIGVLIIINIFSATALLISTQYNEIGIEQLPTRINNCIDDLNVYKRDTDLRIRKLLIDDVQRLNESLTANIKNAGSLVVTKIKTSSGANAIEGLLQKYTKAKLARDKLAKIRLEIESAKEQVARYPSELTRLKNTVIPDIESCIENNIDPQKTFCLKTLELFNTINASPVDLDFDLITKENEDALENIMAMDLVNTFEFAEQAFRYLENEISQKIEEKAAISLDAVKQIGDKLFSVAADISTQIRQVNFEGLYDPISRFQGEQSVYQKYARYSWYATLIFAGVFIFIAFTFLIGLFFGCCGRRPSYYNDDCCVRSNGGRFFEFSIWMCLTFLTLMAILTGALMLIGANLTNVVCLPLEDPLARQDMLSLAERFIDAHRLNFRQGDVDIFNDNRTLTDIIRGCNRNDTFYHMLGIDNKYKLSKLKEVYKDQFNAAVDELRDLIKVITPEEQKFQLDIDFRSLSSMPTVNVSSINPRILQQLQSQINTIDLAPKLNGYNEQTRNSALPVQVTRALDNLNEFQLQTTQPMSHALEEILQDLIQLNDYFSFGSFDPSSVVPTLQHARALLEVDFKGQMETAASDVVKALASELEDYIEHVERSVSNDVTSCAPLIEIGRSSRAALCSHTIYPLNGVWMSMLICIVLMIPLILLSTTLTQLYNQMHAYPKYTVHEPSTDNLCSLATDTYGATRLKQSPYAMTYNYQNSYAPPYLGVHQRNYI